MLTKISNSWRSAFTAIAAAAVLCVGMSSEALAVPVKWTAGNQHWYEVIEADLTWTAAKAVAEGMGGYLATPTTAAENDFLYNLTLASPSILQPELHGPWLGGFRDASSSGAAGWQWVTGETWSFTHWGPGEPNGSGAEMLHFHGPVSYVPGAWNDISESTSAVHGFLVEWDEDPSTVVAPEPGSAFLLLASLASLGIASRRRQ